MTSLCTSPNAKGQVAVGRGWSRVQWPGDVSYVRRSDRAFARPPVVFERACLRRCMLRGSASIPTEQPTSHAHRRHRFRFWLAVECRHMRIDEESVRKTSRDRAHQRRRARPRIGRVWDRAHASRAFTPRMEKGGRDPGERATRFCRFMVSSRIRSNVGPGERGRVRSVLERGMS